MLHPLACRYPGRWRADQEDGQQQRAEEAAQTGEALKASAKVEADTLAEQQDQPASEEAAKAETDRRAAAEQAEQDRLAAEAAATKVEAERHAAAAQAEQDRSAAETAAKPGSSAITPPNPYSDAVLSDASKAPATAALLPAANLASTGRQAKTNTVAIPRSSAPSTAHMAATGPICVTIAWPPSVTSCFAP